MSRQCACGKHEECDHSCMPDVIDGFCSHCGVRVPEWIASVTDCLGADLLGTSIMTETRTNYELQADYDRLRSLNDELQGLCVTHEICVERLQADNDRMRKALKIARKRITFYGSISERRHFDHDLVEIYPRIDEALTQIAQ